MKKVLKQVVGTDVSQDELVVCVGQLFDDLSVTLAAPKAFENNKKGFLALLSYVEKRFETNAPVYFVMEATGVYHEDFAWFLDEQGLTVNIVLPNKISNYMRTLDVKSVTDNTAAVAIAQFGLERKLEQWTRPKEIYRTMRKLTRERSQLIEERTMLKNQLHAENAGACPNKKTTQRINKRIALMDKQENEIMEDLKDLVNSEKEIKELIVLVCTIPGIGLLTAASILGETNGFDLIKNKRQLTSYAGLDIIEKQSGTSVKGKPRISKRGNKHLRKTMHLPALTAIRHNDRYKNIFARLVSKHGIKMKAAVAVQRKLLEMTYTVFKKREAFDKNYFVRQVEKKLEEQ